MLDYLMCGFKRKLDRSCLDDTRAGVVVACVDTGDGLDCRHVDSVSAPALLNLDAKGDPSVQVLPVLCCTESQPYIHTAICCKVAYHESALLNWIQDSGEDGRGLC
jgi:hypothetical protein